MILSFFRHDHKKKILENRRKLKGSHIVIVEDLTRLNNGLMNRLRQDQRIESVWSWEGSVSVKLKGGPVTRVNLFDSVDDLIQRLSVKRTDTETSLTDFFEKLPSPL